MKKIVLAIIVGIIPLVLPAASTDFWFRHFSVEDGLSSNSVRAIMQDKYGFMWLGTDDGLNRYDGTTIKVYNLNPQGSNDYISSLYDTTDNIWIGTEDGVYIFDYETENFEPFKVLTAQGDNNLMGCLRICHCILDKGEATFMLSIELGMGHQLTFI